MKGMDAKCDLMILDTEHLQKIFYHYLERIGEVVFIADSGRRLPRLEHITRTADRKMIAYYTSYAGRNTWSLVEEAIPLLLRIPPGRVAIRHLSRRKLINQLKLHLYKQAFHDEPHRLKVINYEQDMQHWRVLPWDFLTWINYLGLELPAELRDIITNSSDSYTYEQQLDLRSA